MECRSCGWAQDGATATCPRCGSGAVTTTVLWERPVPPAGWGEPPVAPPPPPVPAAAGPTGRGGHRATAGLVLAVGGVAAVLVGALAVRGLAGGGRGASSPEAAVRRLADALSAEDPAAVADALAPDEVAGLADTLARVEERVDELGLGTPGAPLGGVDLAVVDLRLDTEDLGDDLARVTVRSGRLAWSVDPTVVGPTGVALTGGGDGHGALGADDVAAPFLVTVRRDGGWFVSLTATAAEHLVEALGLPGPDPEASDAPVDEPAATPEEAVRELVESVGGPGDDAVAVLADDERRALLPFREAIEDLFGPRGWGGPRHVVVDDLDATVHELDGGARRVVVTGARGTYSDDHGDGWGWEADGWCVTADGPGHEGAPVCPFGVDTYLGRALTAGEPPSVVVVPERGGWVVSPARTVLAHVEAVLPHLDVDVLVTLLGRPDLVAPRREAPFGTVESVELGPAGVTTWTFTPDRTIELVLGVDADASAEVVDSTGGRVTVTGFGHRPRPFLEAGQTYRVVISREARRGGAPVTVALGAVEQRDLGEVALTGTIDETLTSAAPVRRTTFTVGRAVRAGIEVTGAARAMVDSDDQAPCGPGDRCTFLPGTTYWVVTEAVEGVVPEEGIDVAIAFTDRTVAGGDGSRATIDGATSVTGTLVDEADRAVHELVVPGGQRVVLTVRADEADVDVDAVVDGETYQGLR